jgi:Tol biopolymer transport system component
MLLLLAFALATRLSAQIQTCDDVVLLVNFSAVDEDEGQLTLYWYDLSEKSAVPALEIPTAIKDGFRDTTVVVNAWSPDRTRILYTVSKLSRNDLDGVNNPTNVYLLDCLGTHPALLVSGDAPFSIYHPVWSADGASVAYLARTTAQRETFRIEVMDVTTNTRQVLYESESFLDWLHWSPDGLLFIEGAALYLLKKGEKRPLFVTGYLSVKTASPDGTKVSLTHTANVGEVVDILLFDLQTLRMSLLVADTRFGVTSLLWSPDSSQVAFMERGQDAFRVKVIHVDGSGLTTIGDPISDWTSFSVMTEWTVDGEALLLRTDTGSFHDYYLLHFNGELEKIELSP